MIIISLNSQRTLVLALCLAGAVVGCSKKKADTQGAVPDTKTAGDASGTTQATPTGQGLAAVSSADATKILNEANTALKAKDYEKAVEATLAAQRQRSLTEQQMAAMHNQMLQLQSDLANAIARGDAKAKAAADILRRSASGAQ